MWQQIVNFTLVIVVFLGLLKLISYQRARSRRQLDDEFAAALSAQGVQHWALLVDKVTLPSTDQTAEVYRIVRADTDRHFLYTKIGRAAGVLVPLSRERALQAVRVVGQ
ncbi:MAG: hypothetical protein K0S77_2097 [Pseudomonas sp.]|jgi:hypothetical protein|uniref:hypothetical protein n=1 Tax=Pseudomonas entomophila TaxID=312306 RepID=UPI0015E34E70|nr:hypothetical protein [Pseudomonas entomophila]MBA1193187.1 hypothetical protein [Pseudomonas entomophila]MDF2489475.1 hypothetical protein [Pseudomonas sp.]